ncbi:MULTISPECIES: hypothetical protein [Sphingobacterium]|jgi:hypothetical protein|uniref:Uncharacterized protein n=1 Tax=Sphingobacterium kitahiroshimense TaxID=470446 RepID=A0ABV0BZ48_9SPHI|nr:MULTISPECIES: hypothetical protein [Sphingobacterium]KKX47097.1 hypothetical protein L950_0228275 [Sphingobacterium sp. IITKGP-BTPF85]MBB2951369.1 hypothetical protein [Sphingobacterium sp. JUb56]MCS3556395.1 hypothetical protein [Sphingobacterium sp. JUb21]MCW2259880.1 hypothetical protein [Sphingobacterium kitahiroshimense]QQD12131.1 hypothetical protein JAZ75_16080 [Sphingobacterium sp. UDSM-2020]
MKSIENLTKFELGQGEEQTIQGGFNPMGGISLSFSPAQGGESGGTIGVYLNGSHISNTYFFTEHNWVYTSSYM